MIEPEVFSERLSHWYRLANKRKTFTIGQLEQRSGINRAYWSRWMSGKGKYDGVSIPRGGLRSFRLPRLRSSWLGLGPV